MADQPIIEIDVELHSIMMCKLRHHPRVHREDSRDRNEAKVQSLKLVGLHRGHHKMQEMLVLKMNENMRISICQVNQH